MQAVALAGRSSAYQALDRDPTPGGRRRDPLAPVRPPGGAPRYCCLSKEYSGIEAVAPPGNGAEAGR